MVAAVSDTAWDTDTKYNQRLTKRLLRKGTNPVNKVAWICLQYNLVDLRVKARGADIHIEWIHVRIMTDFQRMLTAWFIQVKIWFRHCLQWGEYSVMGDKLLLVRTRGMCSCCSVTAVTESNPDYFSHQIILLQVCWKASSCLEGVQGHPVLWKQLFSQVLWLISITTDLFFYFFLVITLKT